MQEVKVSVDLFLDIHGDKVLPFVFVAGTEGTPNYNERIATLENLFKHAFSAASPDFQDAEGYKKEASGQANLAMATTYVGHVLIAWHLP